ncbi:tyrosine-type recombinase/integrase [Jatrophihabitans telluris]|uniref:Tyrosine-type recombinase/integrase n=1 Tax=Jatrophihabitans telluris TaxID=2038343 RepID=A0ABY4QZG3_9ACTN|nr:tyrosine-type recombinase/integrase [Jatrophihabitans telluris]UQX88955.1 tyrosine-type recombinase/integrase [Jatrophihabitans telluris]
MGLSHAGVRRARLHDARHTAATLLLVQGVDARTVMDLMGWSQISMTTRYQHVVMDLRRAAAERMSDALWGPTATKTATKPTPLA